jgi:hypothetical protein
LPRPRQLLKFELRRCCDQHRPWAYRVSRRCCLPRHRRHRRHRRRPHRQPRRQRLRLRQGVS